MPFLSVDLRMTPELSRRVLLGATVSGLTASLAGCSGVFAETPPRNGPDSFYLENHQSNGHEFTVTITRAPDETEVVNGTYHLPAKHGAVFSEIGEIGTTYHLEVAVDELAPLTRDWSVSKCSTGPRDRNTAGAFFIRTDEMGFAQNQCNTRRVGDSNNLTYVPATELTIEESVR